MTRGPHRDELLPGFLTWTSLALLACLVLIAVLVIASLRVVPEGERPVVSRLGGPPAVRGPGRTLVVPGIDPARHALRPVPEAAAISVLAEGRLRRHVAERHLNELGDLLPGRTNPLAADLDAAVAERGLKVTALEVVRADVPLPALRRWLTGEAAR